MSPATHEIFTHQTISMKSLIYFCIAIQLAVATAHAEKVVFLSGDDEYRSEESMPMLAKMLERDFGFETAVGFSLDENGHINPTAQNSLTMTEELSDADLMVMFLRYRRPSEDVFANILNYINAGKPIVAFRTSTHAFRFEEERGRNEWGYQNDPKAIHSLAGGESVRELLGQGWIIHHGHFDDGKKPLTKVTLKTDKTNHPILRGVEPFEAYSWLYHVQGGGDTIAGDPELLLDGTSLRSRHADKGNTDRYPLTNPIAWTKTHKGKSGKVGRVFTTTLGHSYDFRLAPMRRLAIQGMLWAMGKEDLIPQEGVKTDVVGAYNPSNSGFGDDKFKKGITPEMVLGKQTVSSVAKPNILLIVTDDQSPLTLDCYGDKLCDTPNLDALANSGMVLDRAYHMGSMSGAVCSPSRTMIMSGRTLWHLPPRGKKRSKRGQTDSSGDEILNNTIPAVFNRAGYDTFRTCKKGNSYAAANALFTTVRDKTSRGDGDDDGSQWHGHQALDFLNSRKATDEKKPFLIYLGFSHPHDPRVGREDLLAKYGAVNTKQPPESVNAKAPPVPPTWLPEHPFHHGHPGLRDETKVPGVLTSRTEATVRNEVGREFACIENVDEQVGKVIEHLKSSGDLANTYIIFTSDHGISVGRHGLMGKQNLYEHTWRVPFIVSGPGISAGSRANGNGYLLDILPTICDLAGVDIPATAQGHSLKPVVTGERDSVRDVMYGCYCGGTKPGMRAVRKGDWKLIKYDTMEGQVRETQLFNLAENPHEFLEEHHSKVVTAVTGHTPKTHQVNLANSPDAAEKLAEMEALLLSEMKRLDDPYRLWNQPQPAND